MVIQAYQFAIDPSSAQEEALRSHCGGQRYAYNWGLARIKANLDQREAERSYRIPEADLTPLLSWSAYSLRKDWNQAKHQVVPWWATNSKKVYSSGLANLASALDNWRASKTGTRPGPTMRFPRFKGKRAGMSIVIEDLHVAGMVRNRRLARHIAGVGWGELRRQLAYKTDWRGGRLQVADRWYPSSKTCSDCGSVRAKLALSERRFCCDQCGLTLDRDLNAARNLANLATAVAGTSSPSCGATRNEPAGNPRKTSLAGNGYRHGKTHVVNATPQGGAVRQELPVHPELQRSDESWGA